MVQLIPQISGCNVLQGLWTARGDTGRRCEADAWDEIGGRGHDISGPNTDQATTRSEARLRVDTESRGTGEARELRHRLRSASARSRAVPRPADEATTENGDRP